MSEEPTPRVGVVVTDTYRPSDDDHDTGPLIEALSARNILAEPVVWHRWPAEDDSRQFDLLVLRSPWDYAEREPEFRSWLRTAASRTQVLNTPELVEWNLDKVYLQQLQQRGGGFLGGHYQENPQVQRASAEEIAFGDRVIRACAAAAGTEIPLYGRIDIVTSAEHGTVLLEAELFEPALNLHRAPHAADALAGAIAKSLHG